jgi:hypothetical protein
MYEQVRSEGVPHCDAYAESASRLIGTPCEGGEDAIARSVKQVKRDLKDPERRYQYYRALPEAASLAGTMLLMSKVAIPGSAPGKK